VLPESTSRIPQTLVIQPLAYSSPLYWRYSGPGWWPLAPGAVVSCEEWNSTVDHLEYDLVTRCLTVVLVIEVERTQEEGEEPVDWRVYLLAHGWGETP